MFSNVYRKKCSEHHCPSVFIDPKHKLRYIVSHVTDSLAVSFVRPPGSSSIWNIVFLCWHNIFRYLRFLSQIKEKCSFNAKNESNYPFSDWLTKIFNINKFNNNNHYKSVWCMSPLKANTKLEGRYTVDYGVMLPAWLRKRPMNSTKLAGINCPRRSPVDSTLARFPAPLYAHKYS